MTSASGATTGERNVNNLSAGESGHPARESRPTAPEMEHCTGGLLSQLCDACSTSTQAHPPPHPHPQLTACLACRNKVQHLMHISLQHGFNFLVHPTAFVVHVPHKKPSTKWLTRKMGQVRAASAMYKGGWGGAVMGVRA